jgi:hypothetical protein
MVRVRRSEWHDDSSGEIRLWVDGRWRWTLRWRLRREVREFTSREFEVTSRFSGRNDDLFEGQVVNTIDPEEPRRWVEGATLRRRS